MVENDEYFRTQCEDEMRSRLFPRNGNEDVVTSTTKL